MPIAFGADSVASALHLRWGATPADQVRFSWPWEPLVTSGTTHSAQNRKFSFCADMRLPDPNVRR